MFNYGGNKDNQSINQISNLGIRSNSILSCNMISKQIDKNQTIRMKNKE